jgi:hypothetical protein
MAPPGHVAAARTLDAPPARTPRLCAPQAGSPAGGSPPCAARPTSATRGRAIAGEPAGAHSFPGTLPASRPPLVTAPRPVAADESNQFFTTVFIAAALAS